jgi:adenylate cyclase
MKKVINFFIIYISLFVVLVFFYREFYDRLDSIDAKIKDFMFHFRGSKETTNYVVIVDIDDKSIAKLGQWPWSRDKLAKITKNLTQAKALVIGYDIVFAEKDQTSPSNILKKYRIKRRSLPDYDVDFANVISNSPVILGYKFSQNSYNDKRQTPPLTQATIEENFNTSDNNLMLKADAILNNIPIIEDSAHSSGFFNIDFKNDDGIARDIPLVIRYEDRIYPSLSLEMYRVATGTHKIKINYDKHGISNIELSDIIIPTDSQGRLHINYRGGTKTFKYLSAVDILNNNFDKSSVANKIILVGTSASGIYDLRTTPFNLGQPGVEVHANAIDNMLLGDFISKPSNMISFDILKLSIIILLFIIVSLFLNLYIFIIFTVFIILFDLLLSYHMMFNQGLITNFFVSFASTLALFMFFMAKNYLSEIKKTKKIKNKFASKVSQNVMNEILSNKENNSLDTKNKEVTIFFSDIRNFTTISEDLADSSKLINILNKYIAPMSDIIIEHKGTIDKYIGDAIMAYWNAPLDVENHADKAVEASLKQIKTLQSLNIEFKKSDMPVINIGIGINTGNVVVGEIGSATRSDYSIIGDPVNLSSRLESLCKMYGVQILISEFTYKKLTKKFASMYVDRVRVKGKKQAIDIYQILTTQMISKKLKEEINTFNKAISLYRNKNFTNALGIFKILLSIQNNQNKTIYNIYLKRCQDYISNPSKSFDGIYDINN